ncbi:hypothetical protein Hanom_Chr16g01455641 [Helianthus anomalus]
MHKIKTTRAFQLDTVCNFPDISEKEPVPSESTSSSHTMKKVDLEPENQSANAQRDPAEDATSNDEDVESVSNQLCVVEKPTELTKDLPSSNLTVEQTKTQITTYPSQGWCDNDIISC